MLSYNKFKLRFQRYAIPNLATYISIMFAAGYLMQTINPGFYEEFLVFTPKAVLHGQIWRILTTLFYPPMGGDLLMTLLAVYVYYSMGTTLERWWGSFNYNLYFFSGLLVSELGVLLFYLVTGINLPFIPIYMYFSIFMAYAITFPDATFLLFFVLPIKAKYLAIAEAVIYLYHFITGMFFVKLYIICALIPVAVYFLLANYGGGDGILHNIKREIHRRKVQKEWRDQWK